MIGYLEGTVMKRRENGILLKAGHVGYEVLLPPVVAARLSAEGGDAALFIYYHQTERQPKPVLIGFSTEEEREFFERFLTVGDIGPAKAVAALTAPVHEIARAIEDRDAAALQKLKGIGARTAQKIVAELHGKMGEFLHAEAPASKGARPVEDFALQVIEVLVRQLGHKPLEARDMVQKAMERNPSISGPEDLFDEIYRGER
jgi:Holliday junction DNA helicase RuvA